jgi:3-dehydroquinate synthetase
MKSFAHLSAIPAITRNEEHGVKPSCNRLVGIVDLRTCSRVLALFDLAGRCLAKESLQGHEIGAVEQPEVTELVSSIIGGTAPGLCAVMIIVGTAETKAPRVERIAIDPIPVSIVPEVLAAAYAVPDSWSSFQLIDQRSETWWLIEKKDGDVLAMRSALFSQLTGLTQEIMGHFAALGFVNAAVLGGADGITNALVIDVDALLAGAQLAWQREGHEEGVHVSLDQGGREILQVDADQRVRYRIVHVSQPVFSLQEDALAELVGYRPVLIAIDQTVNAIYGEQLDLYSRKRLNCAGKIVISGFERHKTWRQVDCICREAARLSFPRDGILISVGGGVALDVAGFAASVYRRGVRYLRVPTSLIGLVDAGLGIKQGVNFIKKKNLLGAFYPPIATVNDPSFLTTMSPRDISCGIAEIIKIALVRDCCLFELLEEHGKELLESRFARPPQAARRLLRTAQISMLEELQPNLYETNLLRLVDFGHTFSPLIETQSGYEVVHGYAVALDMLLSTAIAVNRGLCADELFYRMTRLYEQVVLPVDGIPLSVEQLSFALESARLHRGGDLNLVVPVRAGQAVFLQDVNSDDIASAITRLHGISRRDQRVVHASVGV